MGAAWRSWQTKLSGAPGPGGSLSGPVGPHRVLSLGGLRTAFDSHFPQKRPDASPRAPRRAVDGASLYAPSRARLLGLFCRGPSTSRLPALWPRNLCHPVPDPPDLWSGLAPGASARCCSSGSGGSLASPARQRVPGFPQNHASDPDATQRISALPEGKPKAVSEVTIGTHAVPTDTSHRDGENPALTGSRHEAAVPRPLPDTQVGTSLGLLRFPWLWL